MSDVTTPSRTRLWGEFIAFFVSAPVILATLLPPSMLFPGLFGVTTLGVILLHLTPGFEWSDLTRNARAMSWARIAGFTVVTVAVAYAVVQAFAPAQFLNLWRFNPALLLMIAILYPVLSALPQEIVFRPLFFRRYGAILPGGVWPQVTLNAALFSVAHLMYWSWIVAAMTFAGGIAFAWSYRVRANFAEAVVLHSLAGIVIFAMGLGVFFYSGNVVRPF